LIRKIWLFTLLLIFFNSLWPLSLNRGGRDDGESKMAINRTHETKKSTVWPRLKAPICFSTLKIL